MEKMQEILSENSLFANAGNDGGRTAVFRRIACIGDSLSSGEFEQVNKDGTRSYHDMFEYSWGQFLGRMTGSKVYNFSRGGMTAKEYINTFAEANDLWNEDKSCQAYIIALAANDLFGLKMKVGDLSDADKQETTEETFAYYYAKIIERYKKIQPHARFFFVTMPQETSDDEFHKLRKKELSELLNAFASKFSYSYVIDLYKHAPIYDEEFKKKYFFYGHMNPCGYLYTAKMIAAYIDEIIKNDYPAFTQVGFIGTDYYDETLDK